MGKNFSIGYEIKVFDKFSKMLNRFQAKIKASSSSVDKAKKRMDNFRLATGGVTSALKRMAMVGGVALAAVTAMSVKAGSKFEDSMAEFQALTGMRGKDLDTMGNFALKASKKFGIAASEIALAQTRIASGKSELMEDPTGLKAVTNAAMILTKTAKISAEDAGNTVIDTLNIFGESIKGADKAMTAIDQMAQSARVGRFPIKPLRQAFVIAGAQARMAGLGIDEYTAAIQTAGRSGQPAQKVGTQLRNIFTELLSIYPQLEKGQVTFAEVLQDIKGANFTGPELTKMFKKRNVASMEALLKNLELYKGYVADTSEEKSKGAAMLQFGVIMDTLTEKTKKLWATINDKLIGVFVDLLGPVLKKAVDKLSVFTEWLFSGSKSANVFTLALGAMATVLTGLGVTLGIILSVTAWQLWGAVALAAIIKVGTATNFFFGGIPMIIGAIVTLIPALWGLSAWMRKDGDKSFFAVILDDVKFFYNILKKIGSIIMTVFSEIAKNILPLSMQTKGIGDALFVILTAITLIGVGIGLYLIAPFAILMAKIAIVISLIKLAVALLQDAYNFFGELFGWEPIELIDTKNMEKATAFLSELDKIKKGIQNITNSVLDATGNTIQKSKPYESTMSDELFKKRMAELNAGSITKNAGGNLTVNNYIDKDGNTVTKQEGDTKPNVEAKTIFNNGSGSLMPNFTQAPSY